MNKIPLVILFIAVLAGSYIFINKLYYPPLPIDSINKKEVIEKLNNSDEKIVPLTTEKGKQWFIVNEHNQAIVDKIIVDMLQQYGWAFKAKEGSGLIFEKHNSKLIVTTQKWTGNYSLVDIPTHYK